MPEGNGSSVFGSGSTEAPVSLLNTFHVEPLNRGSCVRRRVFEAIGYSGKQPRHMRLSENWRTNIKLLRSGVKSSRLSFDVDDPASGEAMIGDLTGCSWRETG